MWTEDVLWYFRVGVSSLCWEINILVPALKTLQGILTEPAVEVALMGLTVLCCSSCALHTVSICFTVPGPGSRDVRDTRIQQQHAIFSSS